MKEFVVQKQLYFYLQISQNSDLAPFQFVLKNTKIKIKRKYKKTILNDNFKN